MQKEIQKWEILHYNFVGSLRDVNSWTWCFTNNVFTFGLCLKFQVHYIAIIKLMVILYIDTI